MLNDPQYANELAEEMASLRAGYAVAGATQRAAETLLDKMNLAVRHTGNRTPYRSAA